MTNDILTNARFLRESGFFSFPRQNLAKNPPQKSLLRIRSSWAKILKIQIKYLQNGTL